METVPVFGLIFILPHLSSSHLCRLSKLPGLLRAPGRGSVPPPLLAGGPDVPGIVCWPLELPDLLSVLSLGTRVSSTSMKMFLFEWNGNAQVF